MRRAFSKLKSRVSNRIKYWKKTWLLHRANYFLNKAKRSGNEERVIEKYFLKLFCTSKTRRLVERYQPIAEMELNQIKMAINRLSNNEREHALSEIKEALNGVMKGVNEIRKIGNSIELLARNGKKTGDVRHDFASPAISIKLGLELLKDIMESKRLH